MYTKIPNIDSITVYQPEASTDVSVVKYKKESRPKIIMLLTVQVACAIPVDKEFDLDKYAHMLVDEAHEELTKIEERTIIK